MIFNVKFYDPQWARMTIGHSLAMQTRADDAQEAVQVFISTDETNYGPWVHIWGPAHLVATSEEGHKSYWEVSSELERQPEGHDISIYTLKEKDIPRAPKVQNMLDKMKEDFEIEDDFAMASNHPGTCRCEKCLAWWAKMGPDPDNMKHGPFTDEEVQEYKDNVDYESSEQA